MEFPVGCLLMFVAYQLAANTSGVVPTVISMVLGLVGAFLLFGKAFH